MHSYNGLSGGRFTLKSSCFDVVQEGFNCGSQVDRCLGQVLSCGQQLNRGVTRLLGDDTHAVHVFVHFLRANCRLLDTACDFLGGAAAAIGPLWLAVRVEGSFIAIS